MPGAYTRLMKVKKSSFFFDRVWNVNLPYRRHHHHHRNHHPIAAGAAAVVVVVVSVLYVSLYAFDEANTEYAYDNDDEIDDEGFEE